MSQYNYVWRYGVQDEWTETLLQIIGASDELETADVESHDDDNSVYVSWDGEDGSGADGTSDLPFRTLQYALAMMSSDQNIITIKDSNYYYSSDGIDLYLDVDGIVIQGMEGQKPIITLDTGVASQLNMIRLQNAGKIINLEIQIPTGYAEQVTGVDARSGTITNVTILGANKNGINKTTSGTVTIENTLIYGSINDGSNDGSGILFQEGVLSLDHVLIHSNDYAGILATGSATKNLGLDHCTISNNQYGTYVSGATNISMTVIDSIIYKNKIYDHYGDVAVFAYSCVGKVNGNPTYTPATNMLRINPLFMSNEDYNLRTIYNGYGDSLMVSPCVNISSIGDDMGCYQYARSSSGQSYTQITIKCPSRITKGKMVVDGQLLIVKGLRPRMKFTGVKNTLDLVWSGQDNVLTQGEAEALEYMFENANSEVYMSADSGVTYKKYLINKTRSFEVSRALPIVENTLMQDATISLIEV